jgi:DNA-binding IclR family transcriptional regulator
MTDSSDNLDEMHRGVDWLRPSDRVLVAEIAKYEGWMKPATLALNVPYSRGHVARRCKVLAEHGLLERHEDTAGYQVTDFGQEFLNDELDVNDLRLDDE